VLLLENGRIAFDGPTREGLERYLKSVPRQLDLRDAKLADRLHRTTGEVRFNDVACFEETGNADWRIRSGSTLRLRMSVTVAEPVPSLALVVRFRSAISGETISVLREVVSDTALEKDDSRVLELIFPQLALRPGEVSLYLWLGRADDRIAYDVIDENVDLPFLQVFSDDVDRYAREGLVSLDYRFTAEPERR
jgi:hypothetical protein